MNTNTALQVDDNESLASRADEALQQLLYSAHAFAAVAVPVSLSMILSGIAVVFINDGLNGRSTGGSGIPVLFEETGTESNEERFVSALANALIYVGVIIGATFIMVFLYYFKFMRILIGWLVLTTSLLLAFSTGLVVQTGLALGNVPVDAITYAIVFYNFAIVGITAVFYQKGVSHYVTGGYLIAISVTMAWILTRYLPEWTSWVLLGVLALYDLCAVLTPCGPLKWLVGMYVGCSLRIVAQLIETNELCRRRCFDVDAVCRNAMNLFPDCCTRPECGQARTMQTPLPAMIQRRPRRRTAYHRTRRR